MARIAIGDYVTVVKPGTFGGLHVPVGSRGRIIAVYHGSGSRAMKNKGYADVDILGKDDEIVFRAKEMPAWWLRPRTVLDDMSDI